MVFTNLFLPIILLRVTPTAKRNTYSVAWLVGWIPRVACFARNPGLRNRNSFRVAAAYVCFVMDGIMFVCMDVGVAAGGRPIIPRREGALSKRLKHTKYELPPLGEG